jgi:hypothetical protein
MHQEGTAYVLTWKEEELPDFIDTTDVVVLNDAPLPTPTQWETIFVSGGRKDKISKGDIAGFFIKQGDLSRDEIGDIELKQECAFIAVARDRAMEVVQTLDNKRIKKRKLRIYKLG